MIAVPQEFPCPDGQHASMQCNGSDFGEPHGSVPARGSISAEMRLVLLACRWPPTAEIDLALQEAAQELDWGCVAAIVVRHRVAPLVNAALGRAHLSVPRDFEERLALLAKRSVRGALMLARETVHLQKLLRDIGIEPIFVKGAPLGMLAYGLPGMKHSSDVDVLVEPSETVRVRQLLYLRGYTDFEPTGLNDAAFGRYMRRCKEATFFDPRSRMFVDLHSRLYDNPRLVRASSRSYPTQETAVGGVPVRTLEDADLYAYLAMHGTVHCWSRLKWLADLNAFLAGRTTEAIEALHRTACEAGMQRGSSTALLLCRDLLELQLPDRLVEILKNDKAVITLAADSIAAIAHGGGAHEVNAGYYSKIGRRMLRARFLLASGRGFAWSQFWLLVGHPKDQAITPLPGFLSLPLVRLPLLVMRKLRLIYALICRHLADRPR